MSDQNNDTNIIMACVCPHCKQTVRIKRPQKPGRYKFTCTSCATPFALNFTDETKEEKKEAQEAREEAAPAKVVRVHRYNDSYTTIGGLQEKHRGFFGKDKMHALRMGSQLIGRTDTNSPSDISINDDTASRQSVELNVVQRHDDDGVTYSYSLKVRRQKNPVLHNGVALQKGEEIILHIGDTITIGKTKLILK